MFNVFRLVFSGSKEESDTHFGLYGETSGVTVEAVGLAHLEATEGRGLDELRVCVLCFHLKTRTFC